MNIYSVTVEKMKETLQEQTAYTDKELVRRYYEFLAMIRTEARLYYLNDEVASSIIWDRLRKDDDLLHLHLNITGDWISRIFGCFTEIEYESLDAIYNRFCSIVIGGIINENTDSRNLTVSGRDKEFISKTSSQPELLLLFNNEKWLTALIILVRHLNEITSPQPITVGSDNAPKGN